MPHWPHYMWHAQEKHTHLCIRTHTDVELIKRFPEGSQETQATVGTWSALPMRPEQTHGGHPGNVTIDWSDILLKFDRNSLLFQIEIIAYMYSILLFYCHGCWWRLQGIGDLLKRTTGTSVGRQVTNSNTNKNYQTKWEMSCRVNEGKIKQMLKRVEWTT